MAENIFTSFSYSAQGMSAQRKRLNAVANNIANVNTTKGPDGKPYQREVVVIHSVDKKPFASQLKEQLSLGVAESSAKSGMTEPGSDENTILKVEQMKDNTPERLVYEPTHPDADENGYVHYPNINVVTEMVEMISAQRAFEASAGVVEAAKNIARDSLDI